MSMRRLLQIILLAQAVGVVTLAVALQRWLALAPWLAFALALACMMLGRLAIGANNFAMSARFASPTPAAFRLGPAARLRLVLDEFKASMLVSSWHMARASAATRIHPGSESLPVLLLHGYGANSGFWAHLVALLDAGRVSHATLDLEPLMGDIDGYAPRVEAAAEALCAASGSRQLVVVAHSMGGLVARAWLRRYGSARVARLITLGTPHHGTRMARFGPGANAAQMRGAGPGFENDWLRALGAGESTATRALITSIYTHHDNIVAPQTSSFLPGARNIAVGGVGHVALGSNASVLALVMQEIGAASARP
jgi:triacylglycerol esterase/lipase EstA (alpha/beta hydrolase family)